MRSEPDLNVHHNRHHSSGTLLLDHSHTVDNPHNISESVPDPPSQDAPLPTTTQSCDTCGKSFRLKDDFDAHLVRDHDNVDETSLVRDHDSVDVTSLVSPNPRIYCCYKCNLLFSAHQDLAVHIQVMHGMTDIFTCSICESIFTSHANLSIHMNSHHDSAFFPQPYVTAPDAPSLNVQTFSKHCEETSCNRNAQQTHQVPAQVSSPMNEPIYPPNTQPIEKSQSFLTPYHLSEVCGCLFGSIGHYMSHMESQHALTQNTQHTPTHPVSPDVHCNICDQAFSNMRYLNIHTMGHHTPGTTVSTPAPLCDGEKSLTCSGASPITISSPAIPSPIHQLDGNDTLGSPSLSPLELSRNVLSESANVSPKTVSGAPDIQHQYSLNSVNQARRLLDNTTRDTFEIRYSSPQTIMGRQHPTNVSIDCNTGVYLSAVKPALELITRGWQAEVLATLITCDGRSDRTEMSGRKVSAKLVLYLTENSAPSVKCKVVLHFYHTSSTIQAQGSALLSFGVTSPVWLTRNFLEPLATNHANQNRLAIETINTRIRDTVYKCNYCNDQIKSTASRPKDQELPCTKCGQLFHKKCTNRRSSTGNWKRQPWYCQSCILGSQPHSQVLNPVPSTCQPQLHLVQPSVDNIQPITGAHLSPSSIQPPACYQTLSAVQPQSSTVAHPSTSTESPCTGLQQNLSADQRDVFPEVQHQGSQALRDESHPGDQDLHVGPHQPDQEQLAQHQASSSGVLPQLLSEDSPVTENEQLLSQVQGDVITATPIQSQPHNSATGPRFRNTSTRQRGSNVLVNNPELEFHQTALSACRSTITQLEVEQKRLKETLDIRNKRILQLESQIGQATDFIAARDVTASPTDSISMILKRLDVIENKLNQHAAGSPNNIVINTCKADNLPAKSSVTASTQTDYHADIPEHAEILGDNLTPCDTEDNPAATRL